MKKFLRRADIWRVTDRVVGEEITSPPWLDAWFGLNYRLVVHLQAPYIELQMPAVSRSPFYTIMLAKILPAEELNQEGWGGHDWVPYWPYDPGWVSRWPCFTFRPNADSHSARYSWYSPTGFPEILPQECHSDCVHRYLSQRDKLHIRDKINLISIQRNKLSTAVQLLVLE